MWTGFRRRDTARTMSQENVRLAGEVLDAVEQRDLSSLIKLTDPDVDWHFTLVFGEVRL